MGENLNGKNPIDQKLQTQQNLDNIVSAAKKIGIGLSLIAVGYAVSQPFTTQETPRDQLPQSQEEVQEIVKDLQSFEARQAEDAKLKAGEEAKKSLENQQFVNKVIANPEWAEKNAK